MQPCGKHIYSSAANARRCGRRLGSRTRVYYCRQCGGWHLAGKSANTNIPGKGRSAGFGGSRPRRRDWRDADAA